MCVGWGGRVGLGVRHVQPLMCVFVCVCVVQYNNDIWKSKPCPVPTPDK